MLFKQLLLLFILFTFIHAAPQQERNVEDVGGLINHLKLSDALKNIDFSLLNSTTNTKCSNVVIDQLKVISKNVGVDPIPKASDKDYCAKLILKIYEKTEKK